MTERKVTYRLSAQGGDQVKSEFRGIGAAADQAYGKVGKGTKSAQQSAQVFERTLKREEQAFRRLKASVDPAYAAQQRYARIEAQVNAAVRRGIVDKREAARVMALVTTRTRAMAGAQEAAAVAVRSSNAGLRNSLLQINQIGQQAAVTGDFMGALAIQLPDILGGFGGIAPLIAGAAVGLGTAFLPQLLRSRDEVQALEVDVRAAFDAASGAIDEARAAQDRYATAIRLSGEAQDIVTAGVLDALGREAAAREALARLEEVRLQRQRAAAETTLATLRADLDAAIAAATATIGGDGNDAFVNSQAEQARLDAVRATLAANRELVMSIAEQQAQLDLVNALLDQNNGEAAEMVEALAEAHRQGAATAGSVGQISFSASIEGARKLAAELGVSLHRAMQISGLVGAAAQAQRDAASGPVLDPRDPRYDPIQAEMARVRAETGTVSPFAASRVPRVPSARSGGGGGTARVSQEARQAQAIFDRTRTALEKYNTELAEADRLLQAGLISQDTYNRYLEQQKAALDSATQSQQQMMSISKTVKSSIIDAAMGQKDAFEQLAVSIKRAAIEYALFGTGGFARPNSSFGGLLGGLFGRLFSFEGGGDTPSGPRTGGLDGRGGMLAMLHPDETVVDRRKSGSAGSVHVTVGVDDSGSLVPVIRAVAGNVSAQVVGAYARDQRRGLPGQVSAVQARGAPV
jgi:hypothetical protein